LENKKVVVVGPHQIEGNPNWGAFRRTELLISLFIDLGFTVYLVPTNVIRKKLKHKRCFLELSGLYFWGKPKLNDIHEIEVYKCNPSGSKTLSRYTTVEGLSNYTIIFRYFTSLDLFFSFFKDMGVNHEHVYIDVDDDPFDLIKGKWLKIKRGLIKLKLVILLKRKFKLIFSTNDRNIFLSKWLGLTIPNYLCSDLNFSQTTNFTNRLEILFVGNMFHYPNKQGVIWFFQNIWEFVSELDLNFTIIGKMPKDMIVKSHKKISYLEDITDIELSEIYSNTNLAIVPIHEGAGSCVKTLEAYFNGVEILSTSKGMRGIQSSEIIENVRVSDDPNFWINVIHNLCIESKFAVNKSKIIRVPNDYNRESILNKLKSFVN
jgi:hypothetical protein